MWPEVPNILRGGHERNVFKANMNQTYVRFGEPLVLRQVFVQDTLVRSPLETVRAVVGLARCETGQCLQNKPRQESV